MVEAFVPSVDPEIWRRFPEYRALSVVVRNFRLTDDTHAAQSGLKPAPWLMEHIEAWRTAFRSFGANPKRTACSVEALWRRVEKTGSLPTVSPVVNVYNRLSIEFGAPFGGEDLDQYAGLPRLTVALGDESFDTMRDGNPLTESPEPNEIIWRDTLGVTCRRWNWRQCRRTALTERSSNLWFILDRLPPIPLDPLRGAGEALVAELSGLSPNITYSATLLEP